MSRSRHVVVLTSLFPSPPRPREGIFALRRWASMAARGHRVRVVQPTPLAPPLLVRGPRSDARRMPRRETRDGVGIDRPRYLHVPGRALGNARRFAAAGLRAMRAEPRCDVVVCDYAWPAALAVHALTDGGTPCIVNGRGSDVLLVAQDAELRAALAGALRRAGHWTAVSQDLVAALDRVAERPGVGALVPNGVDTSTFAPGARDGARRALGLAHTGPLVLLVGHLIERKDPLLALAAFAEAAPANAHLVAIGRGPLEDSLRAAVCARGLEARVTLRGEVEPRELAQWYRAADVLLLTSSREGRPNVVLEALASACPVVATPVGGTPEVLNALPECLAPSRARGDVAATLRRVLDAPPDAARLVAAVEGFTWSATCDRLEVCIEAAIAAGRTP